MNHHPLRSLLWAGTVALGLLGSIALGAQNAEFTNDLKFNSGQDVQPVFEGWTKAANGGFDLYFGYLNRNWVEKVAIPVGPNNSFSPGPADRGQPTFFYTRTNRKTFIVNVPADFGTKELVWTLTANGKTRTGYGMLKADWEISADGGAATGTVTTTEHRENKAPAIAVSDITAVKLNDSASLVATVSDDGLPKARPQAKPAVGQETPPALSGGPKDPGNLLWLDDAKGKKRPQGLTVRWFVERGPADAYFDPPYAVPSDGQTKTTVHFTEPGEYTLRAAAEDGFLTTYKDVHVKVTP